MHMHECMDAGVDVNTTFARMCQFCTCALRVCASMKRTNNCIPQTSHRANMGPHRAKTDRHRAKTDRHRAKTNRHRAKTGPHWAKTGPHHIPQTSQVPLHNCWAVSVRQSPLVFICPHEYLRPYHHAILSPCHLVTMRPYHHANMSPWRPCQHVTMANISPCHLVTMRP